MIRLLARQVLPNLAANFNKRLLATLTTAKEENGICKITMCDTKTRNSLSINMMKEIVCEITKYQDIPSVRAVILAAEGPVFSSGHNLKELSSDNGRAKHVEVFSLATELMMTIVNCPVPVIARVNGAASAAGCQLVAQCDVALCSDKSSFSTPGSNFGIFCSTPGVALGRCVPKMTAMPMLLTGLPISAQEAKTSGLVSVVCSEEHLDSEMDRICDAIKSKSRKVVAMGKKFYYEQMQMNLKAAYEMGAQVMVSNVNMEDGKRGIQAFVEKRKPVWSHDN